MTLFISEKNKSKVFRSLLISVGITALTALFGFVYEIFSHGVLSYFMYLAFLIPLGLGCLVYLAMWFFNIKFIPSTLVRSIYNTGVGIVTAGFIYKGVTDIYGTPRNSMFITYLVIGLILLIKGILLYIFGLIYNNFTKDKLEKNS